MLIDSPLRKRLRTLFREQAGYILLIWAGAEHKNVEIQMEPLSEKPCVPSRAGLIRHVAGFVSRYT